MDQDHIWCMLTDVLSYTVEENPPSCSYFKPIHTPLVYNTSLFHPQHSNIPCTSQDEISQRTNETNCKVDDNPDHINDRYSEVVSTTTTGFNPSVDICATYLWSDPGSTNLNSDTSCLIKAPFLSVDMVLLLVGWKMEVISEFILCLIQVQQNQFYTKDFMKEHPSCIHIQNTK